MFYQLLDLLACPACRGELIVLAPDERERTTRMRLSRAARPSPARASVGPLPGNVPQTALVDHLARYAALPASNGRERSVEVFAGVLVCASCGRWYPIRDSLPELLPDYLRQWEREEEWLRAYARSWPDPMLAEIWQLLLASTPPSTKTQEEPGTRYKKAEMSLLEKNLPEGFLGPAAFAPFNPSTPNFSLDQIASFITIVSRLRCGINGVVCDIGCGSAWTTEWLVRLGYQGIGLDLSRGYILAGMKRVQEYIPHFIVGDVEHIPLRPSCVDAVTSYDAFHHVPNREQAMKELSRVMRPGAAMVLVEPGKDHESHPRSIQVMQEFGILERGFDEENLKGYIRNTSLGLVRRDRTDVHPHDIFVVEKQGQFETDSLSPRALVADINIETEGAPVPAGAPIGFKATIKNVGDTTWLDQTPDGIGEVHLGARLFDSSRRLIDENFARILLSRPLRPRQSLRIKGKLPAIHEPGTYSVEFDMVDEGFLWFKDYAFQPVLLPLEVSGDDSNLDKKAGRREHASRSAPRIAPIELEFNPAPVDVKEKEALTGRTIAIRLRRMMSVLRKEGWRGLVRRVCARIAERI